MDPGDIEIIESSDGKQKMAGMMFGLSIAALGLEVDMMTVDMVFGLLMAIVIAVVTLLILRR